MRVASLVLGRTCVSVTILGVVGGRAAIVHPIALAFLIIDAAWSVAEGVLARGDLRRTREDRLNAARSPMSDDAKRFLFAGKRYVLVNFVFQAAVLGEFARRAATTPRSLGGITIAGLALYGIGAMVRGWAMASMDDRFKSWTVMRESRGLQRAGIYAIVRHPSYLGLLLIAVAIPLIFGQPWLLALAVMPAAAIAGRVGPEEHLLRQAYGSEYADYASLTKSRLIPGIW